MLNIGEECETTTQDNFDDHSTVKPYVKIEEDTVNSAFLLPNCDPDDREVAMVTDKGHVYRSSGMAVGFSSSSRSSSDVQSGLLSLTPGSSNTGMESDNESSDSAQLDVVCDT